MKAKNGIFLMAGALTFMGCAPSGATPAQEAALDSLAAEVYLVAGSYNPADETGVRIYTFRQDEGTATLSASHRGIPHPSYVAPSQNGKFLFVVSEGDSATDAVHSLSFERLNNLIDEVDTVWTDGKAPCYVTETPDAGLLVTANYNGGSLTMMRTEADGTLDEHKLVYRFTGKGVDKERQAAPHVHFISFTPDGKQMWANDLGTDRIHRFSLPVQTQDTLDLRANVLDDIVLPAGYGPRHLTFTPDGRFAYLLTEMAGKIVGLKSEHGDWLPFMEMLADTVRAGGSADIHVSPDGKYLYTSHRLKGDGIAIFKIGKEGTLTRAGYQPTGVHPRNFALSPNGRFLVVACRDSDVIEIYRRDERTGLLCKAEKSIPFPKASSVRFMLR